MYYIEYENGEKILNNKHEIQWYKTKKSAVCGAKTYAKNKNKAVRVYNRRARKKVNVEIIHPGERNLDNETDENGLPPSTFL